MLISPSLGTVEPVASCLYAGGMVISTKGVLVAG